MNRYINILFASIVLLFASCTSSQNPEFDFEKEKATISIASTDSNVSVGDNGKSADVYFLSTGGSAFIGITAEPRTWEYTVNGQWLNIEKSIEGLTLRAEANDSATPRTATIIITTKAANGNETIAKINVTQNSVGGNNISTDLEFVEFMAGGSAQQIVNVTSDTDRWDFTCNSTWLLVEKVGNTLRMSALPNTLNTSRNTIVKVFTSENGQYITIAVSQKTRSTISVDRDTKSFPQIINSLRDEGYFTFTVDSGNEDYSLNIPENNWTKVTKNGNKVTVQVFSNFDVNDRSIEIKVVAGLTDNAAEKSVFISQIGSDPNKMVLELTITAANTKAILPIVEGSVCTVNWGDGSRNYVSQKFPEHIYEHPDVYYVTIEGQTPNLGTQGGLTTIETKLITGILRWGKTGIKSMNRAFGYTNIKSLPDDTDGSFAETTDFERAFGNCDNLLTLNPKAFQYAAKAENISEMFAYTKVATIPENLLEGMKSVVRMDYIFRNASNLTAIPENIFSKQTNVLNAEGVFINALLITEIPGNLFKNCPEITTAASSFSGCKALTAIQPGLLQNQTKLTSTLSMFFGCTALTTIPADLFANTSELWNLMKTFMSCTALVELPAGLFDGCVAARNLSNIFNGCTSLKTIPAGLFKNCSQAITYNLAFNNCKALEKIYGDMFGAGQLTATGAESIFYGCTSITVVPVGLFDKFTTATSFKEVFRGCTKLASIPTGLFDNSPNVTGFNGSFYGCTSLILVPVSLFDKNIKVTNFVNTFSGCTSLTGETPKYKYMDEDVAKSISLWERDGTNGFDKATGTACFRNCNNLSDIALIPGNYK